MRICDFRFAIFDCAQLTVTLHCPACDSSRVILLGVEQAQCERCGEIFFIPAQEEAA
jgi:ribosomal protein L37AE/L43A